MVTGWTTLETPGAGFWLEVPLLSAVTPDQVRGDANGIPSRLLSRSDTSRLPGFGWWFREVPGSIAVEEQTSNNYSSKRMRGKQARRRDIAHIFSHCYICAY
jgi:hypothetical protein